MKKISPRGGVENNKMWMGEHLEYISEGKWPHVNLFSTLKKIESIIMARMKKISYTVESVRDRGDRDRGSVS